MNLTFPNPQSLSIPAITGCCLALALLLAGGSSYGAQNTGGGSRNDYSEFKVIPDRNIFNPKRSPGRAAVTERPRETRRTTYTRSDSFALVGTMSYAKGPFAFFDSTTTSYRKVVSANDTIADCKVLLVDPKFVKLECGTNVYDLPVGKQLSRQEGMWKITDRIERYDYSSRDRNAERRGEGERNNPPTDAVASTGPEGATGDTPPIIVINGGEGAQDPPPPDGNTPAPASNASPVPSSGSAPANDVLEMIRQRVARERGE